MCAYVTVKPGFVKRVLTVFLITFTYLTTFIEWCQFLIILLSYIYIPLLGGLIKIVFSNRKLFLLFLLFLYQYPLKGDRVMVLARK